MTLAEQPRAKSVLEGDGDRHQPCHTNGTRVHRGVRSLAAVALVASLGIGGVHANKAWASTNPKVTACFRHDNGSPYHQSVFFDERTGSSWSTLYTAKADSDGCATFVSNPNRTIRIQAYEPFGGAAFAGSTGPHDVGTTDVHLGTYRVHRFHDNDV